MNAPIGVTLAGDEAPSRPEAAGTPTRDLGRSSVASRVAFPVATHERIADYWSENRQAMREWAVQIVFGAGRLPVEEAYEIGAWHAMQAKSAPLRWFEASLMRDCIRDVLCSRDAILRRAP